MNDVINAPIRPFYFDKKEHAYFRHEKPYIGTTTALNVLSKELTWWASGQACAEFGWVPLNKDKDGKIPYGEKARLAAQKKIAQEVCSGRFQEIHKLSDDDYFKLVHAAYRAFDTNKEKAKDTGVDMHSMLEDFIRCRMAGQYPMFIDPVIKPFVEWSDKNVKRFLFTELCTFSDTLYCAGTADFGYEDMDDNLALGDFKSSEKPYFSHWAQCGGYDFQISESGGYTPEGKNIFTLEKPFHYYAIFCARAGLDKPFITYQTDRLKKTFSFIVNLYREKMFFEEKI